MESELITIVGTIIGSSLLTIGVLLRQMNHLETKLTARIDRQDTKIDALDTKFTDKLDALDAKFTARIDAFDTKFTDKIDALGRDVADTRERVARIEGHLMAPGSFTTRGLSPGAPDAPQPGDSGSDPDQRQAG